MIEPRLPKLAMEQIGCGEDHQKDRQQASREGETAHNAYKLADESLTDVYPKALEERASLLIHPHESHLSADNHSICDF